MCASQSIRSFEDASSERKGKLFLDETMPSFFRRLAWTPDGALLIAPAGMTTLAPATAAASSSATDAPPGPVQEVVFATHVFARDSWLKSVLSVWTACTLMESCVSEMRGVAGRALLCQVWTRRPPLLSGLVQHCSHCEEIARPSFSCLIAPCLLSRHCRPSQCLTQSIVILLLPLETCTTTS
jgi:hypothetical protein